MMSMSTHGSESIASAAAAFDKNSNDSCDIEDIVNVAADNNVAEDAVVVQDNANHDSSSKNADSDECEDGDNDVASAAQQLHAGFVGNKKKVCVQGWYVKCCNVIDNGHYVY